MPTIRFAAAEDAESIAHVHVASWRTTYRGLLPDDMLDSVSIEQRHRHWQEVLKVQSDSRVAVVALEDDHIIGFATGGRQRDETLDYDGELYALYLLQAYQRQGIGREITLCFAEQLARLGYEKMQVWVMKGNPAQRFYEALGGDYITSKTINLSGVNIVEHAYGWQSIESITHSGR